MMKATTKLLKVSSRKSLAIWATQVGVVPAASPIISLARIIDAERRAGTLAQRGLGAECVSIGARDLLRRLGVPRGTDTRWGEL